LNSLKEKPHITLKGKNHTSTLQYELLPEFIVQWYCLWYRIEILWALYSHELIPLNHVYCKYKYTHIDISVYICVQPIYISYNFCFCVEPWLIYYTMPFTKLCERVTYWKFAKTYLNLDNIMLSEIVTKEHILYDYIYIASVQYNSQSMKNKIEVT
jgi:hypothetical protein